MRSTSTFSILFWIYSSRSKNNQAPLYVRITVNGKILNISLKRKADIHLWNADRQRATGTSAFSRELNHYLNQAQSKLFLCYQEIQGENKPITVTAIKSRYLGTHKTHYTVKDIIEYHNSIAFDILRGNTPNLYLTSQKYIFLFLKKEFQKTDMDLSELDYSFILRFESFLRKLKPKHYQKQIGNNAVMKHIQRLRKMVTLAYHLEWLDRDPFSKFRQKLTKTNREFLTAKELQAVEDLELANSRLSTIRDLFLFSSYTGFSYCDLALLKKKHVKMGLDGNLWIITERQKNGNSVKMPLLPKPLALIRKYDNHQDIFSENGLFPVISNQKTNSYLKEIATFAGITKNLTFHMARHTFATTVTLTNGMPIETISKLLGHSKLSTTQIYAKVIEEKVSGDMQLLKERLG